MTERLASPLKTPSGVVFRNRLVKAAMAEALGDPKTSSPGEKLSALYREWGTGEWGGLLTGNVDVSTIYKGNPADVAVTGSETPAAIEAWERWAVASQKEDTPTLIQLVHPGRQSPAGSGERGFFDKSIAPSAIGVKLGDGLIARILSKVMFGTPRQMTKADIDEVVQQFATAAKRVHKSGFQGLQIHGAHGYLLTQFLSPSFNHRTDDYGGTPAKRARIVVEIIRAIRAAVPPTFCVGIKINSADVGGKESLEESLEQLALIVAEQIDFVEISGGSYENPRMAGGDDSKAQRTAAREAFFLDYAQTVRERFPNIILMVTGGFRTRTGMIKALESGACDLVGIGRPAAVWPHLPKDIYLNREVPDEEATAELGSMSPPWLVQKMGIKLINLGGDSLYYQAQIRDKLAVGQKGSAPPSK
ncbi:NADPH dehydrogenase [Byssothecium circinans]|uniref:NADPH dehydrogenase n=1 Tax=Byssothecium circinans TaxID=147558 RepID=A0A6A5U2A6_9PLEO|nr:NADPH dehydrogenase [Byssothecium circinans]